MTLKYNLISARERSMTFPAQIRMKFIHSIFLWKFPVPRFIQIVKNIANWTKFHLRAKWKISFSTKLVFLEKHCVDVFYVEIHHSYTLA